MTEKSKNIKPDQPITKEKSKVFFGAQTFR